MLIEQLFSGDFRLVHVRLLSSGWQLLSCCLLSLVQLEHSNPSEPRIACSCTSQILFFQARTSQLHSLAARCPKLILSRCSLGHETLASIKRSMSICTRQDKSVSTHTVHRKSTKRIPLNHTRIQQVTYQFLALNGIQYAYIYI